MTETSERYARLAGEMAERIAAVPADGWDAVTPCEGWTARDLLDHLLDGPTGLFTTAGLDPLPPGPDRAEDPVGAFNHVSEAVCAALETPEAATATFDTPAGPQTFESAVSQFLCGDLVVHQWDLARATGQDEALDLDEVRAMHAALLPMDEILRMPGIFGPKVEPPPDADEQTAFLAFLGRQV
jgi:uncharacterized protein (TIGR03086 family)